MDVRLDLKPLNRTRSVAEIRGSDALKIRNDDFVRISLTRRCCHGANSNRTYVTSNNAGRQLWHVSEILTEYPVFACPYGRSLSSETQGGFWFTALPEPSF